eukprot:gene12427-16671_t
MSAQLNYIAFMKGTVHKSTYSLKKDYNQSKGGKIPSALIQYNSELYIQHIVDERVKIRGFDMKIKRLFVNNVDKTTPTLVENPGNTFYDIGWIINCEMKFCMICSVGFGWFYYPHHCKACGNIVCYKCSSYNVTIKELGDAGPLRVCSQCCWGQEVVEALFRPAVSSRFNNTNNANTNQVNINKFETPNNSKFEDNPMVTTRGSSGDIHGPNKGLIASNTRSLSSDSGVDLVQPTRKQSNLIQVSRSGSSENIYHTNPLLESTTHSNPLLYSRSNLHQDRFPPHSNRHSTSLNNSTKSDNNDSFYESNPIKQSTSSPPSTNVSQKSNRTNSSYTTPSNTTNTNATQPQVIPTKKQSTLQIIPDSLDDTGSVTSANTQSKMQKIGSYGTMTIITPNPSFVLKTKRSDSTKIFVNVCTHPLVPYNTSKDKQRLVYMLVNSPVEHTNENDGSYCIIYDVVVSPDEIYVSSIDATGESRVQLCTQSLELIQKSHSENLDAAYKILKLSSNYKGGKIDTKNNGKLLVESAAMPCKEAFIALQQMSTSIAEYYILYPAKSPVKESNSRLSVGNDRLSNSSATGRSSTRLSMTPKQKQLSLLDSVRNNVKVLIKPKSTEDKQVNMSQIVSELDNYEFEMKDMIINPESGFVIQTRRIHQGQTIYVNVCHHDCVGFIDLNLNQVNNKKAVRSSIYTLNNIRELPQPCPIIISGVDNNFNMTSNPHDRAIVIDVVVPSAVMAIVEEDKTTSLKDQLSIEILELLSNYHIEFEKTYSLPKNIPDNHIGKTNDIFPVFNITEFEKTKYELSFLSNIYKQGHGVKSWKERYIEIKTTKLCYYDSITPCNIKGDFVLSNNTQIKFISIYDCNAPTNTFPFKLINDNTTNITLNPIDNHDTNSISHNKDNSFMNCYVGTSELRDLIALIIITNTRMSSIGRDVMNIPDICKGYLKKQGHVIKSWKKRFFILNCGVLKYYDSDK